MRIKEEAMRNLSSLFRSLSLRHYTVLAVVAVTAAVPTTLWALDSDHSANTNTQAPTNTKPTPVYSCNALSIDQFSATNFKFSVKYAARDGATYKTTIYKVYDAKGKEVYQTGSEFKGFTPGTYTVKAFIVVDVNGKEETVTSDACTKQATVPGETPDPKPKPTPIPKPVDPKPEPIPDKPPKITLGFAVKTTVDGAQHKKVTVNKAFTYRVTVTNTGTATIHDTYVTNTAPQGVAYLKASAGTIQNNTWQTLIGELKPNESKTFTVDAIVKQYVAGTLTSTTCIKSDQISLEGHNNCSGATIEVAKPQTPAPQPKPQPTPQPRPAPTDPKQPTPTQPATPTRPTTPVPEPKTPDQSKQPSTNDNQQSPSAPGGTQITNPPAAPTTVGELPRTGNATDTLAGGLGLGALLTAGVAYLISRRHV